MPVYEEKFVCPFSIRFSQERIRPTFQDGRLVERSLEQIEALPWSCVDDSDEYEALLKAPFPPIEIMRWVPKVRKEDGSKCIDEDGSIMLGDACWFSFDNRRLYCLQGAAAKHWPRRVAVVVHIMRGIPGSKSTLRKFRTTDEGFSIRVSRRNDPVPKSIWNWTKAIKTLTSVEAEAKAKAVSGVDRDCDKDDSDQLLEVPNDLEPRSATAETLEELNPDVELDFAPREDEEGADEPQNGLHGSINGASHPDASSLSDTDLLATLQRQQQQQMMLQLGMPPYAAPHLGYGMPPFDHLYGGYAATPAAWYPPYPPWGAMAGGMPGTANPWAAAGMMHGRNDPLAASAYSSFAAAGLGAAASAAKPKVTKTSEQKPAPAVRTEANATHRTQEKSLLPATPDTTGDDDDEESCAQS